MHKENENNGLALVAVLWLVLVLMAIVATAGRTSRLDTKVQLSRIDDVRCRWAGRAGVEKAIALLNEDERETDCLTDLWSDNAADLNDITLEGCLLNVKVIDEASKMNLNTATKEQLLGLPYMTEEIADAILDWRDTDDEPGLAGAESGYYINLMYPYMIRNGSFRTVRELLMVKGVTKELLYGEDANYNELLDYNENDGDQSLPHDNSDNRLDKGWIAYLTCYSSGGGGQNTNTGGQSTNTNSTNNNSGGTTQNNATEQNNQNNQQQQGGDTNSSSQSSTMQVNVNTASTYVLAALMGYDDPAYTAAENIVAYRETLLYGIEQTEDLRQVEGMTTTLFDQISESITVKSDVYMIRCWATANRGMQNGMTVVTEVVVDRSQSPYEILYWYQGAFN